ncbi:MAG: M23 family metallopeptidase [Ilumatobacteraceae bacterium]
MPDVAVVPAGDIDDIDSSVIDNRSTGGTGGGLTGVTGAGGRPGALAGDLGAAGWVCPVQGTTAFADTWGQARSGGRTHQGVDMIAARGLPIVAVVDGFAQSKVNTLGGNTVALSGVDGNRYYYAHLDEWATLGQVTAGTIIGYVGDTGNRSSPRPTCTSRSIPGEGRRSTRSPPCSTTAEQGSDRVPTGSTRAVTGSIRSPAAASARVEADVHRTRLRSGCGRRCQGDHRPHPPLRRGVA